MSSSRPVESILVPSGENAQWLIYRRWNLFINAYDFLSLEFQTCKGIALAYNLLNWNYTDPFDAIYPVATNSPLGWTAMLTISSSWSPKNVCLLLYGSNTTPIAPPINTTLPSFKYFAV